MLNSRLNFASLFNHTYVVKLLNFLASWFSFVMIFLLSVKVALLVPEKPFCVRKDLVFIYLFVIIL